MGSSVKKPWFKRWQVWAGVFVALSIFGAILPDAEEDAEPEVAAEAPAKPKPVALTDEELAAIAKEAEEKAKADQAKWEAENAEKARVAALKAEGEAAAKAKADAEADREFARNSLDEAYNQFIGESEGIILDISPEDDYEIVNVTLADDFAYAPVELRQAFVDDFGGRIENRTRATMFDGRGSSDFIYVYFVNSKGEHLVETKHLDKGWKAK